jgi:hypothetical protein
VDIEKPPPHQSESKSLKSLLASYNKSLFFELSHALSNNYDVYHTSRSRSKETDKLNKFIPWHELKHYDFDYILSIDAPKIISLKKRFFTSIVRTIINAITLNKYLRNHKTAKTIIFSSISVYNKRLDVTSNKINSMKFNKYSIIKLMQEIVMSRAIAKDQLHILRLPAILNKFSSNHLPKRILQKLQDHDDIYVHALTERWNNCLACSDLIKILEFLIQTRFISGISNPHAKCSIQIIDLVMTLKKLTKSNSKIIEIDSVIPKNPSIILTKNLIPTLSVIDLLKEFNSLQKGT